MILFASAQPIKKKFAYISIVRVIYFSLVFRLHNQFRYNQCINVVNEKKKLYEFINNKKYIRNICTNVFWSRVCDGMNDSKLNVNWDARVVFFRWRACTQIAFINNWRINTELIWIWNAGQHSASMVKASTMLEKKECCLFTWVFFFFLLLHTHFCEWISSLVIKAFRMLTSTPIVHNLIFRFYDGVCGDAKIKFFFSIVILP